MAVTFTRLGCWAGLGWAGLGLGLGLAGAGAGQVARAMFSSMAAWTSAGRSMWGMWPAPSIRWRVAPLIASAWAAGITRSALPQITATGIAPPAAASAA